MNARTTKADETAFFPQTGPASTTGLMLSLSRAFAVFSEWSRRRRTMAELNSLSDRELRDIGLTRAEIGAITRNAG